MHQTALSSVEKEEIKTVKYGYFRSGVMFIPKKAEEQPIPIGPYHTEVCGDKRL